RAPTQHREHGRPLVVPPLGGRPSRPPVNQPPSRQAAVGGKEITTPTRADDELEIMRLLARLAQAVDDRDANAYRDCLADEVVCLVSDASPNEVSRAVSREPYARRAIESVSAFDWTHHRLCNFVSVFAGLRA